MTVYELSPSSGLCVLSIKVEVCLIVRTIFFRFTESCVFSGSFKCIFNFYKYSSKGLSLAESLLEMLLFAPSSVFSCITLISTLDCGEK